MSNGYDDNFYDDQHYNSLKSAEIILPIVFEKFGIPASTVDIGGGVGPWSLAAKQLGTTEIILVDGEWVKIDNLLIDSDNFIRFDIENDSFSNIGKFDLVMCMEVAEHLSQNRADSFIFDLCSLSDKILFSAAIPYQGGVNHINEQWLSYWQKIFEKYGYGIDDCIRAKVWSNSDVQEWYSQNAVMFVKGHKTDDSKVVDIIHPALWNEYHFQNLSQ
jgi:hypothetical protein